MFEHNFGALLVVNDSAVVQDPSGIGPTHILQENDAWSIRVNWDLGGFMAPFMGGVNYEVSAYADSLAGGFEGQIGATQPVAGGPLVFQAVIDVPAAAAGGLTAGAYRLTTLIICKDAAGNPLEMAGFLEGPVIQVYAV